MAVVFNQLVDDEQKQTQQVVDEYCYQAKHMETYLSVKAKKS